MVTQGYDVAFDTWSTAGRGITGAGDTLALAVDALCRSLAAAGSPWGDDEIGRTFFNGAEGTPGFGTVRDSVLSGLADMVNLLRATGGTLVVSGRNYRLAEDASTVGGALPEGADKDALAAQRPYRLPAVTEGLAHSDPPPSVVIQGLRFIGMLFGGCEWPDGDVNGLASVKAAFQTAATAVLGVAQEVDGHTRTVTANNAGEAVERFGSFAAALHGGGEEGGLLWLAGMCSALAGSVDFLMKQKNAARLQFELSCTFLVLTWTAAWAISWITGGSSVAAAEAVTEVEGFALRTFVRQIAKAVGVGMWFAGGMDLTGQYARVHEGLQQGFDRGEFLKALGEGAVAGGVMGLAGAGIAARRTRLTTALAGWMGADGTNGVLARLAFNGTSGTLGNMAAQGVVEHHVDVAQAAQFGFGMAGIGVAGELGRYHSGGTSTAADPNASGGHAPPEAPAAAHDLEPPAPPPSHDGEYGGGPDDGGAPPHVTGPGDGGGTVLAGQETPVPRADMPDAGPLPPSTGGGANQTVAGSPTGRPAADQVPAENASGVYAVDSGPRTPPPPADAAPADGRTAPPTPPTTRSAPAGTARSGAADKPAASEGTAHSGAADQAAAPDGAPAGTAPSSATAREGAPGGTAHSGAADQAAAPDGAPAGTARSGATTPEGAPGGTARSGGTDQAAAPGGAPHAGGNEPGGRSPAGPSPAALASRSTDHGSTDHGPVGYGPVGHEPAGRGSGAGQGPVADQRVTGHGPAGDGRVATPRDAVGGGPREQAGPGRPPHETGGSALEGVVTPPNAAGGHAPVAVRPGEAPLVAAEQPVGAPSPDAGPPPAPASGPRTAREVNVLRSADLNPDTRPPLLPAHGERALATLRGEHANTLAEGEALHASQWAGVRESAPATPIAREYHPFENASQVELRQVSVTAPDGTPRTVSEFTVTAQVHTDPAMTPQDVVRARAQVLDAVDLYYNHQHRLPDGSQLHVRVEFNEAPPSTTGVVRLSPGDGTRPGEQADMLHWYADMDPAVIAHEVGHHLDLGDEYVDPRRPGAETLGAPGVTAEPGLMGSVLRFWSDHTLVLDHNGHPVPATVGLRDHHLAELGRHAGHAEPAAQGDAGSRVPGERWTPQHDAEALQLPDHVRDLLERRGEDGRPAFPAEGRDPLEHAAALDRTHALFRDEVPPERLTEEHVRYTEALTDAARRLYETAPDYSFRESDLRGLRALADVVGAAPDGVLPHGDLLHQAVHQTLGHAPSPRAVEALTRLADHLNTEMGGRRPFELPADALHRAAADRAGGTPGPETLRRAIDRLTEHEPPARSVDHAPPRTDRDERRVEKEINRAIRDFERHNGRPLATHEQEEIRRNARRLLLGESEERPKYRTNTVAGIQRQTDSKGNVLDANTGKPIPKGQAHIGHKPGNEWRKIRNDAKRMGLTREQLNEVVQNPRIYQMEHGPSNSSHKHEDKSNSPSELLKNAKKNRDGSITVEGLRIKRDGTVVDEKTGKKINKTDVANSWKPPSASQVRAAERQAAKQAAQEQKEANDWLDKVQEKPNLSRKEQQALNLQEKANQAAAKADKSYFFKSSKEEAERKAAEAQAAADEARKKASKKWWQ